MTSMRNIYYSQTEFTEIAAANTFRFTWNNIIIYVMSSPWQLHPLQEATRGFPQFL